MGANGDKIGKTGHFYDSEGKERYDADLRVARKEDLFPSITSVTKIILKEQLEKWKRDQILKAAVLVKREPHESDQQVIDRIFKKSDEISKVARETGTIIHDMIELYCEGKAVKNFTDFQMKIFNSAKEYIDLNLKDGIVEDSLSSVIHGFGGRIDWHGETEQNGFAVIDWKTQGVKSKYMKRKKQWEKKPVFYDDYVIQLAACGLLMYEKYDRKPDSYISVVLDTTEEKESDDMFKEEKPVFKATKIWTSEEVAWGEDTFLSILQTWRLIKKFEYKG